MHSFSISIYTNTLASAINTKGPSKLGNMSNRVVVSDYFNSTRYFTHSQSKWNGMALWSSFVSEL